MPADSFATHGTPRVSVVLAIHNCQEFVGDAIKSMQAQSVDDWELICVDDASTDSSAEVIEGYAAEDDRIRLVRLESNRGPSGARNAGIEAARGEFIAILDADDIATPDRLAISLQAFEDDPELGLLGGQHLVIDAAGVIRDREERPKLSDAEFRTSLEQSTTIPHSSMMMRTADARAIGGYDERLPSAEDYDLILRMSARCKCARLDRCLLHYRRREGQLSETAAFAGILYSEFARARVHAAAENRPFDEEAQLERIRQQLAGRQGLSRQAGQHMRALALRAVQSGEHARFRVLIRRSTGYWPFSLHTLGWWVLSFGPNSLQARAAKVWSRLRGRRRG